MTKLTIVLPLRLLSHNYAKDISYHITQYPVLGSAQSDVSLSSLLPSRPVQSNSFMISLYNENTRGDGLRLNSLMLHIMKLLPNNVGAHTAYVQVIYVYVIITYLYTRTKTLHKTSNIIRY